MGVDLIWQKFLEKGDAHSFSSIYRRHADELYSYGIHLGFRDETCKDAIQDIFYKLYVSRKKIKGVRNPSAYLFKSYKYRLIDLVRKDARTEKIESIGESFSIDVTVLDDLIDTENAKILKEKIEKLLSTLTAQQREAIYMRYMLGLDYDEIGEILNINYDSARKLIFRAMEKMREQIDPGDLKLLLSIIILLISQIKTFN